MRASVSKETAISGIAPVAVSVVFRGGAVLGIDPRPDHLPAQSGSTNPLATASPHACPASETSGELAIDSLKRPLTGPLSQRKPVQSPSRGAGRRTTYKQGQGSVAFVCELPTQDARGQSRQTTPRRVVDPLSAATASCRSDQRSNFICGPCRPEQGGEAHIHVNGGASVPTFGSRLQDCRCKLWNVDNRLLWATNELRY